MKKTIIFVIFVSSFIFLTACASDDEIADELIDYYNNEWIPIHISKEREMDTAKKAILNITTELEDEHAEEMISIQESVVIPAAEKALERYESLQIKNREVKKLNNMQIKAEKHGRDLLESILDYNNGDFSSSEFRQMENKLEEKFLEINDYLEKLMDKYNLEYDKTKDSNEGYYEIKRKEE